MSQVVKVDGPIVSTLYTYGITQLLFLALNVRSLPRLGRACLAQLGLLTALNVLTLLNTLLVFVILTHITAFLYVALFFGTMATCTALVLWAVEGTRPHWITDVGVGLLVILACWSTGAQTPAALPEGSPFMGFALTLVAALAGAGYLVVSRRFQAATQLKASEIVAIRFTLTGLVCVVWLLITAQPILIPVDRMLTYAGLSLLASAIPLYLMQKSAEVSGAHMTSFYMAGIPLCCFALTEVFYPELLTLWDAAIGLFICSLTLITLKIRTI